MKKINHVLFLGSMMLLDECQQEPGCPFSASRFQYELLSHLYKEYVEHITCICPIPTISYPKDRRLLWKYSCTVSQSGFQVISPPFINWSFIKVLTIMLFVLWTTLKESLTRGKPEIIMFYNPYAGYAVPAWILGKLWRVPVVGIVADLQPIMPCTLIRSLRCIEARLQHWVVKRLDGLLPFSIHVANDLRFAGPTLRLDPGIKAEDFQSADLNEAKPDEKAILFSGVLSTTNGLQFLLDAFSMVEDDTIQLWITGRGDLQTEVHKASLQDDRIHYLGWLERHDLLKTMGRAFVLVNPRPANLQEHRYNFPSKIIEYLAVGRPVISTSSSDVATEYGTYLILVEPETTASFAQIIEETFSKSKAELDEIGRRGREYVLSEKNWGVLSRKVAEFLVSLT